MNTYIAVGLWNRTETTGISIIKAPFNFIHEAEYWINSVSPYTVEEPIIFNSKDIKAIEAKVAQLEMLKILL